MNLILYSEYKNIVNDYKLSNLDILQSELNKLNLDRNNMNKKIIKKISKENIKTEIIF